MPTPAKQRPTSLRPQVRALRFALPPQGERAAGSLDRDSRTCELAFASETPVPMWYGTEILSCKPGAMRMGQRQLSMPLLFNHDMHDLLGVVEQIWIDGDRIARARIRFGKDERGEWAMQQCADGVLCNVSFMYRVFKWEEDTEADTLTALDWEPYEISLVTVPADAAVGVGRSASETENGVQIVRAAAATTPPHADAPGVPSAPVAQTPSETQQEQSDMNVRFRRQFFQDQANDGTAGGSTGGGAAAAPSPAPAAPAAVAAERSAIEQRAATSERERIAGIEEICKRYSLSAELRQQMVQRGATLEQARLTAADVVLERAKSAGAPAANFGDGHNPDLSAQEKARYSMIRAVNAALSGDWSKAGFELECSNEVSKKLGRGPQNERGFFIPTNIPFGARATYSTGASATGGALVATNLLAGSFIEVLRNKARVMQLGATVLSGLVGAVDIPRQSGASSSFWTAEGVDTSQTEATFDKVTLTIKTIGAYSVMTRNMLMQSTPDIDMIARADLIAALALGIDLAAISGSGAAAQPRGIVNQTGVGSVVGGTNGAAITIDHLIDLETAVTSANAPEEALAYLVNAKTAGALKKLKSTTGQYLWTNTAGGGRSATPGEINGYPVARSNQVRSNLTKGTANGVCSELVFGAWNELLIGEWGVLEIVPNPYDSTVFKNGGVMLRALQSVDVGVRHGASFAVMSDALTT